jgi:hypothetical protein
MEDDNALEVMSPWLLDEVAATKDHGRAASFS